jgi:biopolymer transport protein ExbD
MKRPGFVLLIAGLAVGFLLCAGCLITGVFVGSRSLVERQRQIRESRTMAAYQQLDTVFLPVSRSGALEEPKTGVTLYVNLSREGAVTVPGRPDAMTTEAEVRYWLQSERQVAKNNPAQTIQLRADRTVQYKHVDAIRRLGKDAGFASVDLLVDTAAGSRGMLPISDAKINDWRRPETRVELTLVAKGNRDGVNDGNIAALIARTPDGETALPNLEALQKYGEEARGKMSNKDFVRIIPDDSLDYAAVVEVVDACLRAGFPRVVLGDSQLDRPPQGISNDSLGKERVPDATAQLKIEQEIRTIHRADYARTKPENMTALARKLRQAAGDCDGDNWEAARFVLLREAARLAAEGGDVASALQAIDDQARWYEGFNLWEAKLQTLGKALPRASQAVADASLQLASAAFFAGETERTDSFLSLAVKAAQESKDAALVERVKAGQQEIAKLKAQPADAGAPVPIANEFFAGRSGAARERLVREGGGNARSEASVASGLKWIIRHQAIDGHWGMHDFYIHGKCNCDGAGANDDVAGTAFGLLPLLGAGHTHKGTGQQHLYSKNVERGLKWLITRQGVDGGFSSNGYEHALATIGVCEAYGMTADPILKGPAQRAINACVAWQHDAGGFRYAPKTPGDTSVHGWFVGALKTGSMAGLKVPDTTWAGVNKFLDSVSNPEGSAYGYQQPQPAPTVTAIGLLCRQYMGWGPRNPGLQKGLEYLRKLPPSPNFRNIYYYYYATPVLHRMQRFNPEAWEQWNPKMRDLLIDSQDQGLNADRRDQKGSWSPEGDAWGGQLGRLGYTSLAVLTLEVYYRHPPPYRRELGAKDE